MEQKEINTPIPVLAVFGVIMTQGRCGRRRNDRRMGRRRAASGACGDLRRASRTEAAKIGGVTLQVVRDWVLRFNAQGPDGLIDRKAPGQPPRLNDGIAPALAAIIESGPIPAVHGVVRWRIVDLCQWIFEEFRVVVAQQTLSRVLRKMGYRKLSARPRHHAQAEGAIEDFKKASRAPGRDRAREGRRSRRHRGLVRRRGADRPEEQDHPALGQARNAPQRPERSANRSAYIFGAICPKEGKGAALVMPRCDTEAMNLHLAEIATQIAPRLHRRPPAEADMHLYFRVSPPSVHQMILMLERAGSHEDRRQGGIERRCRFCCTQPTNG